MKKFKFTLQTVHSVREMRQEKEQLALTDLQNKVNTAAVRVAQIERMRFAAIEKYAEKLKKGGEVNPLEMELHSRHFVSLNHLQQEAERNLEQKKQACARQSEIVAAASREVKITGQLRENQQARYQLEFARHEQKALDELISANFARDLIQKK